MLRQERVVPLADAPLVASAVDEPFLVRLPDGSMTLSLPSLLGQHSNVVPSDVTERSAPAVTTGGNLQLCPAESILLRQQDGAHPVAIADSPVPTIATSGGHSIATPTVRPLIKPKTGLYRPLMTVSPSTSLEAVTTPLNQPFIDDFEGPPAAGDKPLGTITTRDRFALCVPELLPWGLDVRYRMLQPRELKQAQGFPADYEVIGTKTDRTEQIGNAVPVNLGRALCKHLLTATDPDLATFGGGIDRETNYDVPDYEEVAGND